MMRGKPAKVPPATASNALFLMPYRDILYQSGPLHQPKEPGPVPMRVLAHGACRLAGE